MEEVLDVYQRPRDPLRPLVCLDEKSVQLLEDVRESVAMTPGRPKREDAEYKRQGTANLFMVFAPLEGWREVTATAQRTKVDFAQTVKELVDVHFPAAERIVLVLDNLNTHAKASLYEAFPAPEAKRILNRLEWHYTPKHGSWLNMAEIELSALGRQCLKRRVPDRDTLAAQTRAWVRARNEKKTCADWQFTTADARVKLKRLYPSFQE